MGNKNNSTNPTNKAHSTALSVTLIAARVRGIRGTWALNLFTFYFFIPDFTPDLRPPIVRPSRQYWSQLPRNGDMITSRDLGSATPYSGPQWPAIVTHRLPLPARWQNIASIGLFFRKWRQPKLGCWRAHFGRLLERHYASLRHASGLLFTHYWRLFVEQNLATLPPTDNRSTARPRQPN